MKVINNINLHKDNIEILKIIECITNDVVIDYNLSLEPLRESLKDGDVNLLIKRRWS